MRTCSVVVGGRVDVAASEVVATGGSVESSEGETVGSADIAVPEQPAATSTIPKAIVRRRASRNERPAVASATKTALTLGEVAERTEEVDPAERGPEHVDEQVLGVRRLPEEKPGEPRLPGGADHEIGIG